MTDREQKAQDAQEGELFRLLVENVKDYAIFVIDPEGRVKSWNPGAERLLGFREEEMIGQSIAVFFTPEDIEKGFPQREMQQALKEGRGNDDRWHVRKDGSRFWCGGTLTPLWDEGHKLRGFAKIMRDRTEWKEAEQARRGNEARQAAMLETALDAIITIDHEGWVVEFNPAAERLFGYAGADVRGRDIGQLIVPPRLRDAHQSGMARYLSTGEGPVLGKRIEMPALRADGTEVTVELAITRIPTDGPPLFTAYLRDISEPKRVEEALRRSEEHLRAVVETTPACIKLVAPDGTLLDMNSAGLAMMDADRPENVNGKCVYNLVCEEYRDAFRVFNERVCQGEKGSLEFEIVGLRGTRRHMETCAVPLRWPGGGFVQLAVTHDITDRKRAEDALRESEEKLRLLLKEIHHRVKNNLQIVSSLLNIQSRHTTDRAAIEMFKESRGRVKSMALIHERLYRSQDMARVNFADYVRQLAQDLHRTYRVSEGIRLELDVDIPALAIDIAIPCGLLLNELISNCFKHAFADAAEGCLRVALHRDGAANVLIVADNGTGFPAGTDFRNTTSFGLQLVNTMVDQLDGEIALTTDRGTTFTVRFPKPSSSPTGGPP